MGSSETPKRDRPWLIRTYSGHSTAAESNALFRENLARGQTGLSVAFDLPTQLGYDSDHALAGTEVGKVGVPIGHLGDMERLFDGIPLDAMNTSMTINATAPWLLALYVAVAEKRGIARAALSGTVQNDVLKEYLSRGTYVFPPGPSLRLTTDVIAFTAREIPKWNPVNVCSYHLQEAGATAEQEVGFALANAIAVLDHLREGGRIPEAEFPAVVGRISFFVNAGIRFVAEMCKLRAFAELWDEIAESRYGVTDPKLRRFRYGVQVNSLGLTEQQPENNVYRILLEMLAVVLSKNARARAVQLPAWNEALGLPRPWDQQWSLRLQQIVAFETDLLEYADLFDGSRVVEEKTAALKRSARAVLDEVLARGGAVRAIEDGMMKSRLIEAQAARLTGIETEENIVVGVNAYTDSAPSPLSSEAGGDHLAVDPAALRAQLDSLAAWRSGRDAARVEASLDALAAAARRGANVMEASIACAHAGATTGEWAETLRQVFGEYRPPTALDLAQSEFAEAGMAALRARVEAVTARIGRQPAILIGKPGLDGHSNGAEQIALRARAAGFAVVYEGIRQGPEAIARRAAEEKVDLVGLSVLSGSHIPLVERVVLALAEEGHPVPVVLGGIVPPADRSRLEDMGVVRIYTPRDFEVLRILGELLDIVARDNRGAA
jgi:(2R)-ethylmalonyl-CoA mutase